MWEEEINKQIDEMLGNGVCRPSNSPWSSNVILVKKKDGSMRFAINYRLLNDITKKDAYPIPDIQAILDKLEGSNYSATPIIRTSIIRTPRLAEHFGWSQPKFTILYLFQSTTPVILIV